MVLISLLIIRDFYLNTFIKWQCTFHLNINICEVYYYLYSFYFDHAGMLVLQVLFN